MSARQEQADRALEVWTWFPYRWAHSFMPPGIDLRSSALVGRLKARANAELLARSEANVRRALPHHPNPAAVARRSLAARFLDQLSGLCWPKMSQEGPEHYFSLEGLEHLERAREEGRGIILAHPCMGPIRLGLMGLGVVGHPVVRLDTMDDPDSDGAGFLVRQARSIQRDLDASAPGTVMNGRSYLRPLLRRLHDGDVVALAYDGTPPDSGDPIGRRVEVTLLGHKARFPVGPIYLAMRSHATIHPVVLRRRAGAWGYTLIIEEAFEIRQVGALSETLRANSARLATRLEALLIDEPEQWHLWSEFQPGRMLI